MSEECHVTQREHLGLVAATCAIRAGRYASIDHRLAMAEIKIAWLLWPADCDSVEIDQACGAVTQVLLKDVELAIKYGDCYDARSDAATAALHRLACAGLPSAWRSEEKP